MSWQTTPYLWPLILAGIITLVMGFFAWQRRNAPGALLFSLLSLVVTFWTLGYAGELSSATLEGEKLWAQFEYLGIVTVPLVWLIFVMSYTGQQRWLRPRRLAPLSVIPALTLILVFTNDYHHLIWAQVSSETVQSFKVLTVTHGVWFWIYIVYSYILLLAGAALLVRAMRTAPQKYQGQVWSLLIAAAAPWIANAIYIAGLSPFPALDLTPFGFTLAAIAVAWSIFRYRLLALIPVARDMVVEDMDEAILVLDLQNYLIDFNQAALTILAQSAKEILGHPIEEVLHQQADLVARYRDAEQVDDQLLIEQAGVQRYFDLRILPIEDRYGNPTGRLITLHDVTSSVNTEKEIRRQNEELAQANAALELAQKKANEASRMKSEFMATMSHELRTPLNAMIGYTQLQLAGATGPLTPREQDYQERILHNSRTLLQLINDVLDFAKLESGHTELVVAPTSVREIVESAAKTIRAQAERNGLRFDVDVAADMPDVIMADGSRLRQMMANLLSNALKFTEKGRITLTVARVDDSTWSIVVSDSGIGISAEEQTFIFEAFRQVDSSSERKYGGIGLGLSIIQKLTGMMGATIHVESRAGKGSTFTLTLPLVVFEGKNTANRIKRTS